MSSEQTKPKRKVKDIISKVVGGSLFVAVALLVVFQFIGVISAARNDGVVSYGAFQSYRVATESMVPKYKVDTMVFVQRVDVEDLNIEDDITFRRNDDTSYGDGRGDKKIVTHRIKHIDIIDNEYYFRTMGINTSICGAGGCKYDYVKASDVYGRVVGQSALLGKLNALMTDQPFFMVLFVLVPLVIVFGSSLVDLFKQLKSDNPAQEIAKTEAVDSDFESIKEQEKLKMMIEIEKERMREEMRNGGNNDGKENED